MAARVFATEDLVDVIVELPEYDAVAYLGPTPIEEVLLSEEPKDELLEMGIAERLLFRR